MSKKMVSVFIYGLAAIFLSGCLSIPVSTLYKLARMPDDAVAKMDPADVRAAIELPDNVPVDASKIIVGFCFHKVEGDAGIGGAWPVVLVKQGQYVTPALPTVRAGRVLYLFRLSDDAQVKLAEALKPWRTDKDAYKKADINIHLDAGDPPPGALPYRTSGWFQIDKQQGYLQMLDDLKVDAEDLATRSSADKGIPDFRCG